MLAKCTNPKCSKPFRYLETGILFRLESDVQDSSGGINREYFWLCRGCSLSMSLRLDESDGVRVVQLTDLSPGGEEEVDIHLVDRKQGMVLNRIRFFSHPVRKRDRAEGAQLQL
jgi:hypothetical protein